MGPGRLVINFHGNVLGKLSVLKKKKGGAKKKGRFLSLGLHFHKCLGKVFTKKGSLERKGGFWFGAFHRMSWEKFRKKIN